MLVTLIDVGNKILLTINYMRFGEVNDGSSSFYINKILGSFQKY